MIPYKDLRKWFYKKRFLKKLGGGGDRLNLIGEKTVFCTKPQNIYIGDDCNINHYVYLGASYGKIVIGNNVTLSPYCRLVASGYDIENSWRYGGREHLRNLEIYIGDHTWIGMGAMILPGVKITGKNVVVAAGAVVNKDITEDDVLVAGIPAKIVKRYSEREQTDIKQ